MLAVGFRVFGHEGFQRFVVAADQTVAPALQRMEAFVVLTCGRIELINERQDGVDVLITHQLADVLHVTLAGDMSSVFRRIGEGLAQCVSQR